MNISSLIRAALYANLFKTTLGASRAVGVGLASYQKIGEYTGSTRGLVLCIFLQLSGI